MDPDCYVVILDSLKDRPVFGLLTKEGDKFKVVSEGDLMSIIGEEPPYICRTSFKTPVEGIYSHLSNTAYHPKDLSPNQIRDYNALYASAMKGLSL